MDFPIDGFGAQGDGNTDDAACIQAAIDKCGAAGGGRVILSGGRTYLASSIILKSKVELHLEKGALLKANTAFDKFIRPSRIKYVEKKPDAAHKPSIAWLYAYGQSNLCISGEGAIEGNAESVTRRVNPYYVAGNGLPRPTLIYIENCKDVTVKGVSIGNAPFWTLHLAGCEDVLVSGISIINHLDCANSDGIDPDHCRNVLIENCQIECADDCIAVKNTRGNAEYGSCEGIIVRGCELVSTSAAFKIGTESVDSFRNIEVTDCTISRSNRGISLQPRDGGDIENVLFRNISIDTRQFSDQWWGRGEPVAITALPRYPLGRCGRIRNVRFSNIDCDSENGILIYSKQKGCLADIIFDDLSIRLSVKSKWFAPGYDLRPGFCSGVMNRRTEAFFLHHAGNIGRQTVTITDELTGSEK